MRAMNSGAVLNTPAARAFGQSELAVVMVVREIAILLRQWFKYRTICLSRVCIID
jgi:hypothetical protein